jgi:hypothetical protein
VAEGTHHHIDRNGVTEVSDLSERLSKQMRANGKRLRGATVRGAIYGCTGGLSIGTAATVATAGAGCGAIPAGGILGAVAGVASFGAASLLVSTVQTVAVLCGADPEHIPSSSESSSEHEDFSSRLAETFKDPVYRP